jgi:2-iminoacetate synthase
MPSKYIADFINEEQIHRTLHDNQSISQEDFTAIMAKAESAAGLNMEEVAKLLNIEDDDRLAQLFAAAHRVKEKIYGKRIVIFAPLYVSNYCVNSCTYCGYSCGSGIARKKLNQEELINEVKALEAMGHKRLALEAGEDLANCDIDYILECIKTIYSIKFKNGAIRRINVNIAATTVERFKQLHAAEIGTYILFQESYHRETYAQMHTRGPKHDYDWHTTAFDRAMEAGIEDVGAGVLFGLYDYKFEILGLMQHAVHLEQKFGCGPHTVSVPRLKPAEGVDLSTYPQILSDNKFKKTIAILRLALPYVGIILSTRESAKLRDEIIEYGVSQISAGSCTGVGGYSVHVSGENTPHENTAQFSVEDERSPDEIIRSLCESGYLPSYCTACYRQGRVGDRFMALAKSGDIQNVCQPNALMTFQEYLCDYASEETRVAGEKIIDEHVAQIKSENMRKLVLTQLEKIRNGSRDLYL